ncbi:hypothetical protein KJ785_03070 [Patescibacteria group bacterium]|nr:hypothetical protein [Patescibacteria group bacterium]
MKKFGTNLFLVTCISGIIVATFGPFGFAGFVAMNEATAITPEWIEQEAYNSARERCDCIQRDLAKSLEQMGTVTKQLIDQLNTAEIREADAQAELTKALAEIERLRAKIMDAHLGGVRMIE